MRWNPINTVPTDGTHFDAWSGRIRYAKCKIALYREEPELWWWRSTIHKEGEWVRMNISSFEYWTPIPIQPPWSKNT